MKVKKIVTYLNPIAQFGKKKYTIQFALLTCIAAYILSELFAFFISKQPNSIGTPDVILTFLLVMYFAFRSGIRGGLTSVAVSVVFFTYFILSRHAPVKTKEGAVVIAIVLTVLYVIIALLLGWLRQTIDRLLSQERRARITAEHEQQRWQTLLEQLPVGVIIAKAPNGKIINRNEKATELLGKVTQPTLKVNDYRRFNASRNGKKINPKKWPLAKALLEGKKVTGEEIRMINNYGKEIELLFNATPVHDKRGKVIAAITTFSDITKLKELERQKEDFLAMASHELRTPLTSSKMYVQLALKESANNKKALTHLNKMEAQLQKLTSLVMTMLDATQMQKGMLVLEQTPFILKDSAFDILADLKITTGRTLIIDWQTHEYILGNKERITQVFTNLIVNAAKYSQEGTDIVVRSRKQEGKIIVSVQDFGMGIPKEELRHIFDRFYQTKQHKTYPGLGLGLYISAEIIRQHGGKMWVESEVGKGTTFYFSLPIYTAVRQATLPIKN